MMYPVPPGLEALCVEFEGLARVGPDGLVYPYLCPAGYPTQGHGLRVAGLWVPACTVGQARARLRAVLPLYAGHALRLSPVLARYPCRLAAVADFIFNLGPTAYAGSTLRKKVNARDWAGAEREFVKWVYGGGRVLPGLVRRRAAEVLMFRGDAARMGILLDHRQFAQDNPTGYLPQPAGHPVLHAEQLSLPA